MSKKINISKMDKVEIFRTLYNNAKPQGMGFLHYDSTPMLREEAETMFNERNDKYFDYVKGRVMKIDLSGDTLDPWLYDRDNGDGEVEYALKDMDGFEFAVEE